LELALAKIATMSPTAAKGIELPLEEIDILAGQSRMPEFLAKELVRRGAGPRA
jgi:hypothetical protein